ncbi:amidase signature enzyme [Polychaeton citri CBS 116435]|uniref:Amidase signature enzyme n=1 Tax=Polychaeton citri CBS 116435 TaxID=1314669 RepID=A0A9P4PY02_9PEZI|nr:amidase signature enzyme [Polychaeton citri CBS 116435]
MHFQKLLATPALLSSTTIASSLVSHDRYPALINATIDDISSDLSRGLFTSRDLINPGALAIAAHLNNLRANGTIFGPLHEIPVLLKDNIATNDKLNNTAGSYSLLGAKVSRDSTVVAKLWEASRVVLGKANLAQRAITRSMNATDSGSAYGGQVYVAYHQAQDPRGSSSGSAVAAALGLAGATLGTETESSIISPSNRGNVVGISPTVGLTSRYLVVPVSEHQDTIGPIARTVKDAALILEAIAGGDSRDNYTSAIPHNGSIPKYSAACKRGALHGRRIAQIKDELGATIVTANFTRYEAWQNDKIETVAGNANFPINVAKYFAELSYNPYNLTSLAEITGFTHGFPEEDWPAKDTGDCDGPDGVLPQGWDNTDPRWTRSDAILLPRYLLAPYVPSLVGSPTISVPLGHYLSNVSVVKDGLVFFLGAKWSGEQLVGFAYNYEQLTQHGSEVQP